MTVPHARMPAAPSGELASSGDLAVSGDLAASGRPERAGASAAVEYGAAAADQPWADGSLRASVRDAPATAVYLVALTVTTVALAMDRHRVAHRTALGASTNLHNLVTEPVRVLMASAFLLVPGWLIWPIGALLVTVMAPVERRLGTPRTVLVFAVGHVGATAVTVGGIAAGVAVGWLPLSLTHAVDVGPSYGLAALAGVLVLRLPTSRARPAAVLALLVALGVAAVVGGDFTDAGHLVAAVLGLAVSRAVAPPHGRVGRVGPAARSRR